MNSSIFRDGLFEGKVCLVTGGGTGIGAAVALELSLLGADVVIASRKPEHIEPAALGLSERTGREVVGEQVDIRDLESVSSLVERVLERFGRIDVLVNNGGGQFLAPAETISPRGWDAVVQTNLTGTWNMTRAVADAWMLEHGGKVVNITMLTTGAFPGMAHSVAARGGVESMSRTLALEWATRGIQVNCVAPGFVASSGLKTYPAELDILSQLQSIVPAKRLAHCREIAWAVAWLASEAGDYVTGSVLTVDGGKSLWGSWWPVPDPPDMETLEIPPEPWEQE